jgi:hypothetical protein
MYDLYIVLNTVGIFPVHTPLPISYSEKFQSYKKVELAV